MRVAHDSPSLVSEKENRKTTMKNHIKVRELPKANPVHAWYPSMQTNAITSNKSKIGVEKSFVSAFNSSPRILMCCA
jgi:hypothetical protein